MPSHGAIIPFPHGVGARYALQDLGILFLLTLPSALARVEVVLENGIEQLQLVDGECRNCGRKEDRHNTHHAV